MTDKLSKVEIESRLNRFSGTEEYHRFNMMFRNVVATDGAMEMANLCGAYWLLDVVGSWQRKIVQKFGPKEGLEFQNWTLKKRPRAGGCIVTCDDGNGNKMVSQTIPYTDFPLDKFGFYCMLSEVSDGKVMVILLKNEY